MEVLGLGVVPVYGGSAMDRQIRALRGRADVIVATPGRAIDHIKRGTFVLDAVKLVVLDEADEMLDMGFAGDLETILRAVPPERQIALFSATMPPHIASIAQRHLRNPKRIIIAGGDIVGAITGEAGISGRALGAINMTDRFATVEVPEDQADVVIRAPQNHHQGPESHHQT